MDLIPPTPFSKVEEAMAEAEIAMDIFVHEHPSREASLARTNLQQAHMWLTNARALVAMKNMTVGGDPQIDTLCSQLGPLVTTQNHDQIMQLLSFYYTEKVS